MHTINIGSNAEAHVCAFLELNGLEFVQKNYRCRLGELDLIMLEPHTDTLVFVEVRFRSNAAFGSATETVTRSKQTKLKRAVLHYLQKHSNANQRARIDVFGVCEKKQDTNNNSTANANANNFGVTVHDYENLQLRWTRNAIEE